MLELILCLIILVLLIISSAYEIKKYWWIRQNLKKPFKRFKKNYLSYGPHENIRYQLSTNSLIFLTYYRGFDQKSLENLNLDLRSKLKSVDGNKHFINYLTVGIIPMFSMLIAMMSVYLNDISLDQKIDSLPLFLFLLLMILFILFRDLTCKTFITTPMQSHLFAIEEVLKER
ncbi:hypothetical protein D3C74_241510 [compost metagenome]